MIFFSIMCILVATELFSADGNTTNVKKNLYIKHINKKKMLHPNSIVMDESKQHACGLHKYQISDRASWGGTSLCTFNSVVCTSFSPHTGPEFIGGDISHKTLIGDDQTEYNWSNARTSDCTLGAFLWFTEIPHSNTHGKGYQYTLHVLGYVPSGEHVKFNLENPVSTANLNSYKLTAHDSCITCTNAKKMELIKINKDKSIIMNGEPQSAEWEPIS